MACPDRARQSINHPARVISKLPARYGDHGQPVRAEGRDLHAVPFERDAPRVTVPTIELHRDCEFAPQEVHLVAVNPSVGLEPPHAGATEQAKHRSLTTRSSPLRPAGQVEDAT